MSWLIAYLLAGIAIAQWIALRDLSARIDEEKATSNYLTGRLAQLAMSQNNPGVAAPKADAIGFDNSPGPQEGELAVPFGALQAQQPCESIPAELSTEGE